MKGRKSERKAPPALIKYWTVPRELWLRFHFLNETFREDLRAYLGCYSPEEADRVANEQWFWDFRLDGSPEGQEDVTHLAGFTDDVMRLEWRWPKMPRRFWCGLRNREYRRSVAQPSPTESVVMDPARPVSDAKSDDEIEWLDEYNSQVRRACGELVFENASAVIPVYAWTQLEDIKKAGKRLLAARRKQKPERLAEQKLEVLADQVEMAELFISHGSVRSAVVAYYSRRSSQAKAWIGQYLREHQRLQEEGMSKHKIAETLDRCLTEGGPPWAASTEEDRLAKARMDGLRKARKLGPLVNTPKTISKSS